MPVNADNIQTLEELFAAYGNRWSVRAWWNDEGSGDYGAKLGPLSINAYRWFDDRWRVGVTWNWSKFGLERIVFGGPL